MTTATEPNLREEYARYFFSMFDACLHQDEVGRRLARQSLEEALDAGRYAARGVHAPDAAPRVASRL